MCAHVAICERIAWVARAKACRVLMTRDCNTGATGTTLSAPDPGGGHDDAEGTDDRTP